MAGDRPLAPRGRVRLVCETAARVDIGTVDVLARVALTARRLHCELELCDASPDLRALLELAGLAGVVRCAPGSAGEAQG